MDFYLALRIIGCIMLFAFGGVYLKRFTDFGVPADLAISLAAYLLANLAFLEVLRRGLGFGMVVSSMGQLCLMVLVGAFVFGERIRPMQGLGVALALLAMAAFAYDAGAQS